MEPGGSAVHPVVERRVGQRAVAPDDGRLVRVVHSVEREDERRVSRPLRQRLDAEPKAGKAEVEEHATLRRDARKGARPIGNVRKLGGFRGHRGTNGGKRGKRGRGGRGSKRLDLLGEHRGHAVRTVTCQRKARV